MPMPCIVGNVKILSVGSGGIVQFEDALQLSPSSISRTYAGVGSFLTGDSTENNIGNSGIG